MKKVTIEYTWGKTIEFRTDEIYRKKEFGFDEIGYLPEGKKRKCWFIVDGRSDSRNDYTGTKVTIEEV